jgi:hypothetical protein
VCHRGNLLYLLERRWLVRVGGFGDVRQTGDHMLDGAADGIEALCVTRAQRLQRGVEFLATTAGELSLERLGGLRERVGLLRHG